MQLEEQTPALVGPPFVHVIFIIDDSGSMNRHKHKTKEAFWTFVSTLKECKGAEIRMSLIKFGDRARIVFKGMAIQDVKPIDWYNPSNSYDVIYDAIMEAIKLGEQLRFGNNKVVVCLQADGGDTSSKHRPKQVAEAVKAKIAEGGWEFNYLAAGDHYTPESIATCVGFPVENMIVYNLNDDQEKSESAYRATATNIAKFSTGRAEHTSYSEDQRKATK